jgi:hypothetical protein
VAVLTACAVPLVAAVGAAAELAAVVVAALFVLPQPAKASSSNKVPARHGTLTTPGRDLNPHILNLRLVVGDLKRRP